jgi:hypothetical protein
MLLIFYVNFIFLVVIEKLTLQVPWKNLYTNATKATIDGLYLLVVPKTGLFILFDISIFVFFCK